MYIAGPYRARTTQRVDLNIEVATYFGLLVAQKGWMPVIPHKNTAHFEHLDPDLPDKFWLDGTLELAKRCDAVFMIPGYESSEGSRNELSQAFHGHQSIYKNINEVPNV